MPMVVYGSLCYRDFIISIWFFLEFLGLTCLCLSNATNFHIGASENVMHVDARVDNDLKQNRWFPFFYFPLLISKTKVRMGHFWFFLTANLFCPFFYMMNEKNAWYALMNVYGFMSYPRNAPRPFMKKFVFFLNVPISELELLRFWILCLFTHSFFTLTHTRPLQDVWYQSLTWFCLSCPFFNTHFFSFV